jgi:hypothetical protein
MDFAQSYLETLSFKFCFHKKLLWSFGGQHQEVAKKLGRIYINMSADVWNSSMECDEM